MRSYILSLGLILGFSCAHSFSTNLTALVTKKASFELRCSTNELTVTELSSTDMSNMAGSAIQKSYGVQGCAKRVSYDASCVRPLMQGEMCDAKQSSSV